MRFNSDQPTPPTPPDDAPKARGKRTAGKRLRPIEKEFAAITDGTLRFLTGRDPAGLRAAFAQFLERRPDFAGDWRQALTMILAEIEQASTPAPASSPGGEDTGEGGPLTDIAVAIAPMPPPRPPQPQPAPRPPAPKPAPKPANIVPLPSPAIPMAGRASAPQLDGWRRRQEHRRFAIESAHLQLV